MRKAIPVLLAIIALIAGVAAAHAQTPPTSGQPIQVVHGQVVANQGQTLTLKADDGRQLTVDMSAIDAQTRQSLAANDRATVIGFLGPQPTQFTARYIQEDGAAGSTAGATSSGTTASTAAAPAPGQQWQTIHGRVVRTEGQWLIFNSDDGRTITVDMAQVGANIQKDLTANEGVTVIGFPAAQPNHFTARYIQQDSSNPARGGQVVGQPAAPADEKGWQRVHGTVVSTSGTTLQLKADDGRTLTVDMAQVGANIRQDLKANEGVTVIGFPAAQPNQFTARYIQQDSSDPARGGQVVGQPAAPADEKGWQRVHGKVVSTSGTTMQFKADDGRTLTVDMAQVGANIRQALKANEGVTVIGFAGAQPNQFTARYIQQDSSAAASPKTTK